MSEELRSLIFGATRTATEEEKAQIARIVEETPVAVFAALNNILNDRGLCITIDALDKPGTPS